MRPLFALGQHAWWRLFHPVCHRAIGYFRCYPTQQLWFIFLLRVSCHAFFLILWENILFP